MDREDKRENTRNLQISLDKSSWITTSSGTVSVGSINRLFIPRDSVVYANFSEISDYESSVWSRSTVPFNLKDPFIYFIRFVVSFPDNVEMLGMELFFESLNLVLQGLQPVIDVFNELS